MVAEEDFVNVKKILILLLKSQKRYFQGILRYKTIQSRSLNFDLRLHGAGAERNIFSSATQIRFML